MSIKKNLPTPDWFDPQRILSQVLDGQSPAEIAGPLKVTQKKLAYWMRTKAPQEWKEAQRIRALQRKEEAELEIETAKDALELNRANSKLKAAQWDLERICREIYGDIKDDEPKQTVTITIGIMRPEDNKEKVINPGVGEVGNAQRQA